MLVNQSCKDKWLKTRYQLNQLYCNINKTREFYLELNDKISIDQCNKLLITLYSCIDISEDAIKKMSVEKFKNGEKK